MLSLRTKCRNFARVVMNVEIDPHNQSESLYRVLSSAVTPRPIGWVSTTGPDSDNLAPYSFFNVVAVDPPILMFAPTDRDGQFKDTPRNVRETGEFVVNVVTDSLAGAMNQTSATLSYGESEFKKTGLDAIPGVKVDSPRVADAAVQFECQLYEILDVGTSTLVLGEVVYVHVADEVTTDGKLDVTKLNTVGRLAGSWYCRTHDRFTMERPP